MLIDICLYLLDLVDSSRNRMLRHILSGFFLRTLPADYSFNCYFWPSVQKDHGSKVDGHAPITLEGMVFLVEKNQRAPSCYPGPFYSMPRQYRVAHEWGK